MSKFVELVPDYIVNIDCIFSMQKVRKSNENAYGVWECNYQQHKKIYMENLPDVEIDGKVYKASEDDEQLNEYAKAVNQKILNEVGNPPPSVINECTIITCTGVKIIINEEKYDAILNYINSNNFIKEKLDKKLKQ